MKKGILTVSALLLLLTAGCGQNSTNAENEALKEQLNKMEQQLAIQEEKIASMEQQNTEQTQQDNLQEQQNTAQAQQDNPQGQQNSSQRQQNVDKGTTTSSTTHTLEQLTLMVEDFVKKAEAASSKGNAQEDMEAFFALKQEEKGIDEDLDRHEDELEAMYEKGSLTGEDYKRLERELEKLEDKLDTAEDRLERVFGIDD